MRGKRNGMRRTPVRPGDGEPTINRSGCDSTATANADCGVCGEYNTAPVDGVPKFVPADLHVSSLIARAGQAERDRREAVRAIDVAVNDLVEGFTDDDALPRAVVVDALEAAASRLRREMEAGALEERRKQARRKP